MTTPQLQEDVERDEGKRNQAYRDTLGNWTIGHGHTGLDVYPGLIWTDAQCEAALDEDLARAIADLDRALPWWRRLNDARQDVLANMAFNMGIGFPPNGGKPGHGLLSFTHTLKAIQDGDFATAAAGMRQSTWAKQVKGRAERLAKQMETGQLAG